MPFLLLCFSHDENLYAVVDGIAKIDWHDLSNDRFGQIYEGLIEKSSQDVRSGAGQYFTPRALVNSIVRIIKPQLGELIQDPASGSGGFLIAADRFIHLKNTKQAYAKKPPKYQGVEIEKNTRRICLMNTFLNGLDAEIIYGDALTDDAKGLQPADIIIANPPFGSKAGSRRSLRSDLPYHNANKQLAFLQHIYLSLKKSGRAAVVLPENVLSDGGIGRLVRRDLMDKCNLHTVLKLPTGIFSSTGVKTNVLFFSAGSEKENNTDMVWFYDLRTNMPAFGKNTPLLDKLFSEFEKCFGSDPYGKSERKDQGMNGRFRCFTRQEIADRDDDLSISWLREENNDSKDATETPEEIAILILSHLQSAMNEIEAVVGELIESTEVSE